MLLTGFFMILVGTGLIWQPVLIWPYLTVLLLILPGIGFALRGICKAQIIRSFFLRPERNFHP